MNNRSRDPFVDKLLRKIVDSELRNIQGTGQPEIPVGLLSSWIYIRDGLYWKEYKHNSRN